MNYTSRLNFLSTIGAIVSLYLIYHFVDVVLVGSGGPSACALNAAFDCDKVAKSEYAKFLTFPLASWGLAYYFAFFLFADRKNLIVAFVTASSVISGLLIWLSLSKLNTSCIFCLLVHLVNFTQLAVIIYFEKQSFFPSLMTGLRELIFLPLGVFRENDRYPVVWSLILAGISFALPDVFQTYLISEKLQSANPSPSDKERQVYDFWVSSPQINLDYSKASFSSGPAESKVSIAEFSDFECPACRMFSSHIEKVAKEFPVRFYFYNFPLSSDCNPAINSVKHRYACGAARLAICSAKYSGDAFWKTFKGLFAYTALSYSSLKEVTDKNLTELGQSFSECTSSEETSQKLKLEIEQGIFANVQATPSVFVNGKLVPSSGGAEGLDYIIKKELGI